MFKNRNKKSISQESVLAAEQLLAELLTQQHHIRNQQVEYLRHTKILHKQVTEILYTLATTPEVREHVEGKQQGILTTLKQLGDLVTVVRRPIIDLLEAHDALKQALHEEPSPLPRGVEELSLQYQQLCDQITELTGEAYAKRDELREVEQGIKEQTQLLTQHQREVAEEKQGLSEELEEYRVTLAQEKDAALFTHKKELQELAEALEMKRKEKEQLEQELELEQLQGLREEKQQLLQDLEELKQTRTQLQTEIEQVTTTQTEALNKHEGRVNELKEKAEHLETYVVDTETLYARIREELLEEVYLGICQQVQDKRFEILQEITRLQQLKLQLNGMEQ